MVLLEPACAQLGYSVAGDVNGDGYTPVTTNSLRFCANSTDCCGTDSDLFPENWSESNWNSLVSEGR